LIVLKEGSSCHQLCPAFVTASWIATMTRELQIMHGLSYRSKDKYRSDRLAAPMAKRRALKPIPLSEVYQLIEPGPVVMLSTAHRGRANVMTMSWHMMVEFEPPLIACVVSGANHSFTALRASRQCVIAIPARKLASKVVKVGNTSGRDTDKFEAFGLTPLPASQVKAPLIAECFANLECKVADTRLVRAYNLFILEVVAAWRDPAQKHPKTIHHHGYGRFVVDGPSIRLKSRMR
jgi:flavin reductase (DIM6/NTAB) family NADH-FMN oxidoreductase RutF